MKLMEKLQAMPMVPATGKEQLTNGVWKHRCIYMMIFMKAGMAQALYNALFEILKIQGFRNVYAVINLPNEKSVAFHEKMGFR